MSHRPSIHSLKISIHAPREEGDYDTCIKGAHILNFYPRPPRGGRHHTFFDLSSLYLISIHAPREEGDQPYT